MARRTALRLFTLANNAYRNATVTFYAVDSTTLARTAELVTIYDAASDGEAVSNPYTLNSSGRAGDTLYTDVPVIAVINSSVVGEHETGAVFPQSSAGWRGTWETSATYLAGEWVRDDANGADTQNIYVCEEDHVAGTWATDLSNDLWTLIIDQEAIDAAEGYATQTAADAVATAADRVQTGLDRTSATNSAAAAAISETNAANSAATNNITAPSANKQGAVLVQNAADDGWNGINSQGSLGDVFSSGGSNADPSWVTAVFRDGAMIHDVTPDGDYPIDYIDYDCTLTAGSIVSGAGTATTVALYLSSDRTSASGTAITGGSAAASTTKAALTLTANNTISSASPKYLVAKVTGASALENVAINISRTKKVNG